MKVFFMEFRMYWIVNHSLDPTFNLALEEYFLGRIEPGHPGYAILWQNSPAIVVGRFQNTRQEVNADFVRERGISVVRRMTGGGAVYHDAGTLNYTFIHHLDKEGALPAFSEAGKPIAEALQKLGLPVTFSGRNDLMLDGLKVAGVAHCRRGMRYLHHGCILVNSDLDVLSQALNVDPAKYKSKGVASVRSRVGNLAGYLSVHSPDLPPLTVQRVRDAIMEHRSGDEYRMNAADFVAITRLRDAKYSTWDWTYGASPPFTERKAQRFPWGKVEVSYDIRQGSVVECHFYGDFFMAGPGKSLTDEVSSCEIYDLEEAMQKVMDEYAGGISSNYQFNEKQLDLAEEKILKLKDLAEKTGAEDMHELLFAYELKERLLVCQVLIEHLKNRKETRWHSFNENLDHPETSRDFEKYVNSRMENGKIKILFRELVKGDTYEHTNS